ncbi:putative methyl-accepting chemotaxis protein (plasmid) [Bacillus thuringiensis serovar morrisoni str. 4AA1]|uniref:methyl-accepting chemotaxis protein n=1 Tax=Bacillus thuringiensis TaxID=1428 RepID=UPI0005CEBA61|nr:chemotaxis protein [Bacillus thuringiensis serovar morrisoni]AJQ62795.1 chemotaxis protein [Bacillus thuringiensis serovar morrisoni]OTY47675.1 methyl-accepting chemotaxis protein [Bacillus thuringiensis serovar poloniensis]UOC04926.1 putative methyl-accepting chemotaxis protein [Bacillus thuringiensis serovar morrisoni str. 4AA1]
MIFNLKQIRISTKLNVLLVIVCFTFVILTLVGYSGLKQEKEASSNMYVNTLLPIQWIGIVESNFYHINMNLMEIMISTDEKRMKELEVIIDEASKENEKLLKQFESRISSSHEKNLYTKFIESYNRLEKHMESVRKLGYTNNEEAYTYYLKEINPSINEATQSIRDLIIENNKHAEKLQEDNINSAKNIIFTFILISIIAIIIVMTIGYVIRRAIQYPINLLQYNMEQVAKGDLTIRSTYKVRDEMGIIATSFNYMLNNLQELIGKVTITTQGVIVSTDSMLQDTKHASTISNEINQITNKVNKQIEEQVISIQQSSIAMQEITTGIQTVADSASTVAELAVSTTERANDGSKVVQQSILQLNSVHEVVEEISKAINRLVTRTQHIDKALNVITNIAEQTNLLALNAAIEAARAGSNGKGFAVVAAEVRNLAEQSKKSANEINNLVTSIKQDSQDTIQVTEKGQQKTEQGRIAAQQAEQSFSIIMKDINKITHQIQEVSATTEEMSAGLEEINASISIISENSTQVVENTHKTGESIRTQAKTITEIANTSSITKKKVRELEGLISQFTINKEE